MFTSGFAHTFKPYNKLLARETVMCENVVSSKGHVFCTVSVLKAV